MAPASGMIVSSLPLSKSGVGSAVNDVTREVGGAIGIAIMGSVLASVYNSHMTEKIRGLPVPPQVRPIITDSIGKAFAVADQSAAAIGPDRVALLQRSAKESFVSGQHATFLVAAAVSVVAALIAGNLIPNVAPIPGSAPEPGSVPSPA